MTFDKKFTPSSHLDYIKMRKEVDRVKKIKVSIIFNVITHRMIKALTATEGGKISDLIEALATQYLKERGKI